MAFFRGRGAPPPDVTVLVDGEPVSARAGETVAAALGAAGRLHLRDSPKDHEPRGAFCFSGVCQECAIWIDGRVQQACLVPVRPGLEVALRGRAG